ncbi:MAG: hypothetical protein FWC55_07755, partial [Firmicutes bacterium]|nr:hypothetical protein [Bacillota bacterium]
SSSFFSLPFLLLSRFTVCYCFLSNLYGSFRGHSTSSEIEFAVTLSAAKGLKIKILRFARNDNRRFPKKSNLYPAKIRGKGQPPKTGKYRVPVRR